MLSIELLGGWAIKANGRHVRADLGSSGRRLCAYLAHHAGRSHRRDKLADMFWTDIDAGRARAALNTALWRLRRLLSAIPESNGGQTLVTLGDEVALESADWLDIDSNTFNAMARDVLRSISLGQEHEAIDGLMAAMSRYSGPFLDGDDDEWILVERECLHSLYVRTAQELAKEHTRRGQLDEAIQTLRSVLASDPFRESTHRDLLVLLLLNEQRGEALRAHERWAASIGRELGIRPMPQTEALIATIRSSGSAEWLGEARAAYVAGRSALPG